MRNNPNMSVITQKFRVVPFSLMKTLVKSGVKGGSRRFLFFVREFLKLVFSQGGHGAVGAVGAAGAEDDSDVTQERGHGELTVVRWTADRTGCSTLQAATRFPKTSASDLETGDGLNLRPKWSTNHSGESITFCKCHSRTLFDTFRRLRHMLGDKVH